MVKGDPVSRIQSRDFADDSTEGDDSGAAHPEWKCGCRQIRPRESKIGKSLDNVRLEFDHQPAEIANHTREKFFIPLKNDLTEFVLACSVEGGLYMAADG